MNVRIDFEGTDHFVWPRLRGVPIEWETQITRPPEREDDVEPGLLMIHEQDRIIVTILDIMGTDMVIDVMLLLDLEGQVIGGLLNTYMPHVGVRAYTPHTPDDKYGALEDIIDRIETSWNRHMTRRQ
jgi:hypothetical protein